MHWETKDGLPSSAVQALAPGPVGERPRGTLGRDDGGARPPRGRKSLGRSATLRRPPPGRQGAPRDPGEGRRHPAVRRHAEGPLRPFHERMDDAGGRPSPPTLHRERASRDLRTRRPEALGRHVRSRNTRHRRDRFRLLRHGRGPSDQRGSLPPSWPGSGEDDLGRHGRGRRGSPPARSVPDARQARWAAENTVFAIRETNEPGDRHAFWIGTDAGLARFADGRFTVLGRASGFRTRP